jgi:preprotein translocase subunit SecF
VFFRNLNWDIIGQRKIWFALSAAVIVVGIIALFVHHGLRLGLSFTGGSTIDVKFVSTVTESSVRQALRGIDLSTIVDSDAKRQAEERAQYDDITSNGEGVQLAQKPEDKSPNDRAIISTQGTIPDAGPVYNALDKAGLKVDRAQSQLTAVGPSLSQEYLNKSLWALVIALVLQLVYIAFRFGNQLRYGIVADLALIHDVFVMVGIYAIANRPADDAFLAALLTVIGYSVMDSIVIFDRIRENGKLMADVPYGRMVNTSLLQTMTRSVNTLATVLIVLLALYFYGGDTLKNFAFALIVGVTSGAYSSIFIASPLLVMWKNYDDRSRGVRRAAAVAASAAPAPRTSASAPPAQPSKRVPPKPKRSAPPPPRYRRKRDDIDSETPANGASVGVMTDGENAAIDADEPDAPTDEG